MRGPPTANVLPDRTVSGQHAASPGTSTSRPGPSRRELRTWLKVSLHICLKGILCRVDGGEGGSGGRGGQTPKGAPRLWAVGPRRRAAYTRPALGRPALSPAFPMHRCTEHPAFHL